MSDDDFDAAWDAEFGADFEEQGVGRHTSVECDYDVDDDRIEEDIVDHLDGEDENGAPDSPSHSSQEDLDEMAEKMFDRFDSISDEPHDEPITPLPPRPRSPTPPNSRQQQHLGNSIGRAASLMVTASIDPRFGVPAKPPTPPADLDTAVSIDSNGVPDAARLAALASANAAAGDAAPGPSNDAGNQGVDDVTFNVGKHRKKIRYDDFDDLAGDTPTPSARTAGQSIHTSSLPDADNATGHPAAKRRRIMTARPAAGISRSGTAQAAATAKPEIAGGTPGNACTHPSYYMGMCVQCGAEKPKHDEISDIQVMQGPTSRTGQQKQPAKHTTIKHLHSKGHLEVSAQEATRLKQLEVNRLLAARKLVLVLDLDHTLVNSVKISDLTDHEIHLLDAATKAEEESGRPSTLFCLRDKNLWSKLRPGIHTFLDQVKQLYELHIYTMGDKTYAAEMRRIMDPTGKIFVSAISQSDSTSAAAKDLDVALAEDKMVVILDDTEQVWPKHRKNLIQVDRYHYFTSSLRQWGHSGKSLLDTGEDESSAEGTLAVCTSVLKDVHARFFSAAGATSLQQRDVRYLLSQRREQALQDCVLLFSSCWPMDHPNPYEHPLWRQAEALGAEVLTTYEPERTTHVVAAVPDTEKAHKARRDGKHVVSPQWIQACWFRWSRVPEVDYVPVRRARGASATPGKTPPPPGDAAAAAGPAQGAGQEADEAVAARALAAATTLD